MLALFLPGLAGSIILGQNNVSVLLGAVSYDKNPFWSKRIPGLHYLEDGTSLPIQYSYGERRLILPFNENVQKYTSPEIVITKSHFKQMKTLASKDPYLRFYVGTTSTRVKITKQKGDNEFQFATSFTINIDNSKDVAGPLCTVLASDYQTIATDAKVAFTINWRFATSPSTPKDTTYLPQILIGVSLFLLAIILSAVFVKKRRTQESIVPYSEIFRLPQLFHNDLLVISTGLLFVVCAIFITRFCYNKKEIGIHLQNVMLLLLVAPVQLTALIGKTICQKIDDTAYCSIPLFYYMIVILPVTAFNVISGFFGSFLGFRIRRLVLSEPFVLLLSLVVCCGWGKSGYLFDTFFEVEASRGESNFPLKPRPFFCHILNLAYIVACVVLIRPAGLHLYDVFYNDAALDYQLMWSVLILYGGASALFGVVRTWYRTSRLSTHWTDGHILYNVFVALGGAGVFLLDVFTRNGLQLLASDVISFVQVYGFAAVLAWSMLAVVTCIGAFFSYVWSFVIVLMGYAQNKSS